jgi:two-component system response regulator (stage 0 sporulation protein A)
MNKGANYYMVKPISFNILKERLIGLDREDLSSGEVFGKHREITLDEKISKIFINVGIPPHIKGYSYLREGVKMAVNNPNVINNITKKLYPSIGEKYQTSASKVERAIRHAIEVAWNRGRIDNINNILGVRAFMGTEKPTNGEFIALVADKMLLEKA